MINNPNSTPTKKDSVLSPSEYLKKKKQEKEQKPPRPSEYIARKGQEGGVPSPSEYLKGRRGKGVPTDGEEAAKEDNSQENNQGRLKTAGSSLAKGFIKPLSEDLIRTFAVAGTEVGNKLGFTDDMRPEDSPVYKAANWVQESLDEIFPQNKEYQEEFFTSKLPQGLGSALAFVSGGALGKGVKGGTLATSAALGSSSISANEYKTAKDKGATDEEAFDTFLLNLPVGATEALPIGRLFKRLDRVTGGGVKKVLAEGFKGGVEEATQETIQQTLSNTAAQNVYDETRKILDGLGDGAGVGFGVGFLLNSVGVSLKQRKANARTEEGIEQIERAEELVEEVRTSNTEQGASKEEGIDVESSTSPQSSPPDQSVGTGSQGEEVPGVERGTDTGTTPEGGTIVSPPEFTFDVEADAETQLAQLNAERNRLIEERNAAEAAGEDVRAYNMALEGLDETTSNIEQGTSDDEGEGQSAVSSQDSEARGDEGAQGLDVDQSSDVESSTSPQSSPSQGEEGSGVFRTADARFRVEKSENAEVKSEKDGAGSAVRIVDEKSGSELSRQSKNFNPALAEWVVSVDERSETQDKRFSRVSDEMGAQGSVSEWVERVALESQNPMEIVEAFDEAESLETVETESDASNAMNQFFESLESGRKIERKDIERIKGSDFIKENRILYTVTTDEETSSDLDEWAEIVSRESGHDYTSEDVIDALLDYKRGRSKYSDTKDKLRERFQKVTGHNLTDNLVAEIRKRDTPDFTDEGGQVYLDRFTVPQQYVDESGQIDYQSLWENDLQNDQNRDYWTGIINLSETQYGDLKNEVRKESERAKEKSETTADARGEAEDAGGAEVAGQGTEQGQGSVNSDQLTEEDLNESPIRPGEDVDTSFEFGLNSSETLDVSSETAAGEDSPPPQSSPEGGSSPEDQTPVRENQQGKVSRAPEVQGVEAQLTEAQENLQRAQSSLENKQRELEQTVLDDSENLFGERPVESASQQRMFDERAQTDKVRSTLQPFIDRRDAAKEEVSRLRQQLDSFESGETPQTGTIEGIGESDADVNPSKSDLLAAGTLPKIRRIQKQKGAKKTPVSREDIANHVIDKLQMAIGTGKSGSLRNALGVYRTKPGRMIRLRVANDINTLAHEVGHGIHHILFDNTTNPAFDSELLRLGEPTSRESYSKQQKIMEGQAEFFRYLMLDPAQAREKAPTYFEEFSSRLEEHPELQQNIDELYMLYNQYLEQDPVKQFESQIAYDDQSPTRRARQEETTMQYLYRKIFDDLIPLKRISESLKSNDTTNEPDTDLVSRDAFRIAQLNKGIDGLIQGWVQYGVRDPDGNIRAKGLDPIFRDNGINSKQDKKEFDLYLLARRAKELYTQQREGKRKLAKASDDQGGPLGVTETQADAVIESYIKPEFEQAASELYAWNDAVLEWMIDREYVSREQMETMKAMNQNYVPMHRIMDFMEQRAAGNEKASLVDQPSLFNKITGSGRRIKPAVETLILNTKKMINAAEQNFAALNAFDKLKNSETGGEWADKVMRPMKPVKGDLASIRNTLEKAGLEEDILNYLDLNEVFTLWRPARHNPQQGEVMVRRNGKPHIWQVHNESLYDALTNLNPQTNNFLVRLLTLPRNVFRHGVVMSLNFITGNTSRDQFTAHLNSRYGYASVHLNPFKKDFGSSDFFKGMASIIRRDENYRLWLQSKAGISGIVDQNRNTIGRTVKQLGETKTQKIIKGILFPARWLETIEGFSSIFENASRVGEFQRGLEVEGTNEEGLSRSAISAREISGDFARGGEWSKFVGKYKAFFNAGLQGDLSMAQAIKRDPTGFMMRGAITMTTLTLALNYLNRGNTDWEEREEERSMYWLIPIGDPKTTTQWFRLRKPWTIGQFFGTVLPEAIESGMDQEFQDDLASDLFEGLSASRIVMDLMPNAVLPMVEVSAGEQGYVYFWQQSIDPYFDTELEPWMRYDGKNSELEKMIGKTLNFSPRKIRHVIRGYGGTFGVELNDLTSEYIVENLKGLDRPPSPEQGLGSTPGLKPFFSPDLNAGQSKTVQEFYDVFGKARTASRTLNNITEKEERARYIEENRELLRLESGFNRARNRMAKVRDQIAEIYESHVYTPEAKREMLKDKNDEIIRVAKIATDVYERYQEKMAE